MNIFRDISLLSIISGATAFLTSLYVGYCLYFGELLYFLTDKGLILNIIFRISFNFFEYYFVTILLFTSFLFISNYIFIFISTLEMYMMLNLKSSVIEFVRSRSNFIFFKLLGSRLDIVVLATTLSVSFTAFIGTINMFLVIFYLFAIMMILSTLMIIINPNQTKEKSSYSKLFLEQSTRSIFRYPYIFIVFFAIFVGFCRAEYVSYPGIYSVNFKFENKLLKGNMIGITHDQILIESNSVITAYDKTRINYLQFDINKRKNTFIENFKYFHSKILEMARKT